MIASKTPQELESMLTNSHNTSAPVTPNMHLGKTKMMFNDDVTKSAITVDNKNNEEVASCVCLGRKISREGDIFPELKRTIALGWATFAKVDNIMKSRKASIKIKRNKPNEYILPKIIFFFLAPARDGTGFAKATCLVVTLLQ